MTHVRAQVRAAVITKLRAEFGDEHVGDITRLLTRFQKRNLPFVAVAVADRVSKTDREPAGYSVQQHDFTIGIRACVSDEDDAVIDSLDALGVRIEKTLVSGYGLGVGALGDWQTTGTTAPQAQEVEDGVLIASTTTFTATMLTLDADPETNLHPQA